MTTVRGFGDEIVRRLGREGGSCLEGEGRDKAGSNCLIGAGRDWGLLGRLLVGLLTIA